MVLLALVVMGYLMLPMSVFQSYVIKGTAESYGNMTRDLDKVRIKYSLPLTEIDGGKTYTYKFVKGMDHVCVIRIIGAGPVINRIQGVRRETDKPYIDGLVLSDESWYYDETKLKLKQYVIDHYSYYVVDTANEIVWYVGYST